MASTFHLKTLDSSLRSGRLYKSTPCFPLLPLHQEMNPRILTTVDWELCHLLNHHELLIFHWCSYRKDLSIRREYSFLLTWHHEMYLRFLISINLSGELVSNLLGCRKYSAVVGCRVVAESLSCFLAYTFWGWVYWCSAFTCCFLGLNYVLVFRWMWSLLDRILIWCTHRRSSSRMGPSLVVWEAPLCWKTREKSESWV